MREDRFKQHDLGMDKYIAPAGGYNMNARDYVVRPSADGNTGPWTLMLPPVGEARGRFYSVVCRNADAVNFITITDAGDSECWMGNFVLNGKCDKYLFYSDGMCWHACNVITTFVGTTPAPATSAPTTAGP